VPGRHRRGLAQRRGPRGSLRLGGLAALSQRRGNVWERDAGSPGVGNTGSGESEDIYIY